MQDVLIESLMTKSVDHDITPQSTLSEVATRMRTKGHSCAIVVEDDKPVGIVTERDMVRILSDVMDHKSTEDVHVAEFMSTPPLSIKETASLFDALVLTQARKIRHLPVVNEEGFLTGILTYTDLAHAHVHIVEMQREIIEREVRDKTKELQDVNDQLKALSMEDVLLEIGNRRAMEVDLDYTHSAAIRYKRPYSVVLFDVDYFKLYNDNYGHAAGDQALKHVANHLMASIRKSDRLYRYGGEEILLLLPETELEGAHILAQRITQDLAERVIPHDHSPYKVLTMSGGISCSLIESASKGWRELIEQADKGLYIAKDSGRNQVCFAT